MARWLVRLLLGPACSSQTPLYAMIANIQDVDTGIFLYYDPNIEMLSLNTVCSDAMLCFVV